MQVPWFGVDLFCIVFFFSSRDKRVAPYSAGEDDDDSASEGSIVF